MSDSDGSQKDGKPPQVAPRRIVIKRRPQQAPVYDSRGSVPPMQGSLDTLLSVNSNDRSKPVSSFLSAGAQGLSAAVSIGAPSGGPESHSTVFTHYTVPRGDHHGTASATLNEQLLESQTFRESANVRQSIRQSTTPSVSISFRTDSDSIEFTVLTDSREASSTFLSRPAPLTDVVGRPPPNRNLEHLTLGQTARSPVAEQPDVTTCTSESGTEGDSNLVTMGSEPRNTDFAEGSRAATRGEATTVRTERAVPRPRITVLSRTIAFPVDESVGTSSHFGDFQPLRRIDSHLSLEGNQTPPVDSDLSSSRQNLYSSFSGNSLSASLAAPLLLAPRDRPLTPPESLYRDLLHNGPPGNASIITESSPVPLEGTSTRNSPNAPSPIAFLAPINGRNGFPAAQLHLRPLNWQTRTAASREPFYLSEEDHSGSDAAFPISSLSSPFGVHRQNGLRAPARSRTRPPEGDVARDRSSVTADLLHDLLPSTLNSSASSSTSLIGATPLPTPTRPEARDHRYSDRGNYG